MKKSPKDIPAAAWLMKSEPDAFSWADLWKSPERTSLWDGIRNYQARNFMMQRMNQGDSVLFYHSNAGKETGIVGLATVATSEAEVDPTQFQPDSDYYDPKSSPDKPRWWCIRVKAQKAFPRPFLLSEIKNTPGLEEMALLQKGQRLSIQPVEQKHLDIIMKKGFPT